MMNKGLRTKVTNMCRRDLKRTHSYKKAKDLHFKGKTVYMCPQCNKHFYTGASEKNFLKLKEEEYPDLTRINSKKMVMDHIDPVVPYDKDLHSMTMDEIIPRIYCSADNLQYIDEDCHKIKNAQEAKIRAKYRELEKLDK